MISDPPIDVLALAEDPGAANTLIELPATLAELGYSARLLALGPSVEYLATRAVPHERLTPSADPADLLAQYRPRVVIVGTSEDPRCLGLRLISEARARGIPTLGVVDAPANAAHRFRGLSDDPLAHAPDQIAVPDTLTAREFVRCGIPAVRLHVCGNPHFDRVRARAAALALEDRAGIRLKLFPSLPASRPILLFVAELSSGLDPAQYRVSAEYTLHGEGNETGRTENVIQELLRGVASYRDALSLVLRLHPKQTTKDLDRFVAEFDCVSQGGDSLELLHAADAVIGMSSMMLAEALAFEKPTLAILPRACERDWLLPIAAGLIATAHTRPEVANRISRLLADKPPPRSAFDELYPPGATGRLCRLAAGMIRTEASLSRATQT